MFFNIILFPMYVVFNPMCAYVKLFIVWLLIVVSQIYSYDILYVLC